MFLYNAHNYDNNLYITNEKMVFLCKNEKGFVLLNSCSNDNGAAVVMS